MDQTTVARTVGAGVAGINRDTVDIDLEPAIAAGRAITALSARCCCCRDPNRSTAAQFVFSTAATGAGLISPRICHLRYANYAMTANHSAAHYDLGAGGRAVNSDGHDGSQLENSNPIDPNNPDSGPHCYAGGRLQRAAISYSVNSTGPPSKVSEIDRCMDLSCARACVV